MFFFSVFFYLLAQPKNYIKKDRVLEGMMLDDLVLEDKFNYCLFLANIVQLGSMSNSQYLLKQLYIGFVLRTRHI